MAESFRDLFYFQTTKFPWSHIFLRVTTWPMSQLDRERCFNHPRLLVAYPLSQVSVYFFFGLEKYYRLQNFLKL